MAASEHGDEQPRSKSYRLVNSPNKKAVVVSLEHK